MSHNDFTRRRLIAALPLLWLATPLAADAGTASSSPKLKIITRRMWSRRGIEQDLEPLGKVRILSIHHTDEESALMKLGDVDFLRAIENHHRDTRKWACIGYHFLIGRNGQIYEGRPESALGAHVHKHNAGNLGIALLGDFTKELPPQAQLASLEQLLARLRQKYALQPRHVFGHGQLGKTTCPGPALQAWIHRYRLRKS